VQGATETYSNFFERLYDALMNHPDLNGESKQQMFRLLAFDNANKATKQLLAGLPKGAGVEDMLLSWFRLPPATKAPRRRPFPRQRAEENGKKQAETGGSG